MTHKGIHSRGYLPHWDFADSVQAITFRLADSLPDEVVKEWKRELEEEMGHPDHGISERAKAELQRRIAKYEDAGLGGCVLRDAGNAAVVQRLLIEGHGKDYRLIDWCVMPNHVHVLVRLLDGTPLGKIVKQWKGASAVEINRRERRNGTLWMVDYHDRMIRDMGHLHDAKAYIRNNPVKARLCEKPEDWTFSGAGANWSAEFIPQVAAGETGGMNSALPVTNTALNGHLHLRCETRADGVPFISHQDFRAPIHLSKSHLDEGKRVLSIVNPTAGFFDGDTLESEVAVGGGAGLVLSTPSASRVYRTRSGNTAVCHQRFRVEDGGFLEWIPEPFIPHAGARYRQRTCIDLDASAGLLFFEWISPGRVAMGEVFAYRQLRWELDLFLAGKLLARERYQLDPEDSSLEALRARFPAAHYLSVYAAGGMTGKWPSETLDGLNDGDTYLGHGPLGGGVHVIRALCRDSLAARRLMERLRSLLYEAAGEKPPTLGRLFL